MPDCLSSFRLKQTWIDKGLRLVNFFTPRPAKYWHWNRPELIRDYDPRLTVVISDGAKLKQTWIDKGLRRGVTALFLHQYFLHWNRPELIRDYDQDTAGLVGEFFYTNWNRPELIRDYDSGGLEIYGNKFLFSLKQTWIDKGLRRLHIFRRYSKSIKNWNRPELIRDYDS